MEEITQIESTVENLTDYPDVEDGGEVPVRKADRKVHLLKGMVIAICYVVAFLIFLALVTVLIWWIV